MRKQCISLVILSHAPKSLMMQLLVNFSPQFFQSSKAFFNFAEQKGAFANLVTDTRASWRLQKITTAISISAIKSYKGEEAAE